MLKRFATLLSGAACGLVVALAASSAADMIGSGRRFGMQSSGLPLGGGTMQGDITMASDKSLLFTDTGSKTEPNIQLTGSTATWEQYMSSDVVTWATNGTTDVLGLSSASLSHATDTDRFLIVLNADPSSTQPVYVPRASDPTTGMGSGAAGRMYLIAGGSGVVRVESNGSSSNYANRTMAAAATTDGADANFLRLTGDGGGNSLSTITGGWHGYVLTIQFQDSNITVVDDDTPTASNAINLAGTATNWNPAVNDTLTLVYDGTSWFETSRSDNN